MTSWNDERIHRLLSTLLIIGVMVSALVVLLGGACQLVRHGQERADFHVFHAAAVPYRSVHGVTESLGAWDCSAIMQLGLLLLIATPVARVILSLAGFAMERDYKYVALTSLVLLILICSLRS